jgi:DNA invertase Pin-like site-specific DNA recombinase
VARLQCFIRGLFVRRADPLRQYPTSHIRIRRGTTIFAERTPPRKRGDRAELARVIKRLQPGDVLVVTRLDRLARSTRDLLNVLEAVKQAGAGFRSLKDAWCTPPLLMGC